MHDLGLAWTTRRRSDASIGTTAHGFTLGVAPHWSSARARDTMRPMPSGKPGMKGTLTIG
jgi:hypothetical protein